MYAGLLTKPVWLAVLGEISLVAREEGSAFLALCPDLKILTMSLL